MRFQGFAGNEGPGLSVGKQFSLLEIRVAFAVGWTPINRVSTAGAQFKSATAGLGDLSLLFLSWFTFGSTGVILNIRTSPNSRIVSVVHILGIFCPQLYFDIGMDGTVSWSALAR